MRQKRGHLRMQWGEEVKNSADYIYVGPWCLPHRSVGVVLPHRNGRRTAAVFHSSEILRLSGRSFDQTLLNKQSGRDKANAGV